MGSSRGPFGSTALYRSGVVRSRCRTSSGAGQVRDEPRTKSGSSLSQELIGLDNLSGDGGCGDDIR
jgi:hypothetical protein